MMKINKNEQDFVLKYFQSGKLDTRKALQKVKARVGIADEEVSHAATVSLRMRRIRWIAVAASILVLFTIGAYTLLLPKTVTLSAESEVMAYHLPDGTKVSLMPHRKEKNEASTIPSFHQADDTPLLLIRQKASPSLAAKAYRLLW